MIEGLEFDNLRMISSSASLMSAGHEGRGRAAIYLRLAQLEQMDDSIGVAAEVRVELLGLPDGSDDPSVTIAEMICSLALNAAGAPSGVDSMTDDEKVDLYHQAGQIFWPVFHERLRDFSVQMGLAPFRLDLEAPTKELIVESLATPAEDEKDDGAVAASGI